MAQNSNTDKEYEVQVVRTAYAFKTIKVKANSEEEAKEKALDEAGDHEFSEKSSDYSVDGVSEI